MAKRCNCWSAWVWQRYCPVHGDPKQLKIDQKAEEQREKELDKAADELALDYLFQIFGTGKTKINNYLDVWMSHNYDHDYWVPCLAEQQQRLNEYQVWAQTITDDRAKNAYVKWLNYYQKSLDSGRNELITKAEKNKMEESVRLQKKRVVTAKELNDKMKTAFPQPPQIR